MVRSIFQKASNNDHQITSLSPPEDDFMVYTVMAWQSEPMQLIFLDSLSIF